eukprot:2207762-Pyramimonas_sp.AAC.1
MKDEEKDATRGVGMREENERGRRGVECSSGGPSSLILFPPLRCLALPRRASTPPDSVSSAH